MNTDFIHTILLRYSNVLSALAEALKEEDTKLTSEEKRQIRLVYTEFIFNKRMDSMKRWIIKGDFDTVSSVVDQIFNELDSLE